MRPQTTVFLLLQIRRRRLGKLLRHVKDESMIHLSYTNRTLSFILYSLYNVNAATRYTLHATRHVNDYLRDRSSSSSTDSVHEDADEIVKATDDGGYAAGEKKMAK